MSFIFCSRIVIIRIYFPWKVISKKYFSWTVMRTLSPIHLCESAINFAINFDSFSNIYFFNIIRGSGQWWKWKFEIKTQDRTLSKNNNPGLVFYLKKSRAPVSMTFFFKLIIWNIDIHTCLLDNTFLCPHL